jgi:RNA polymerase sigma factor (sigma-70 family)
VPIDFLELENNDSRAKAHSFRSMNAIEITEALAIKEVETPDHLLQRKELIDIADNACDKLDSLEQEVILRIFIKGEKLINIAKELGYSRCHISRVKSKALNQLQGEMLESLKVSEEKSNVREFTKERKKFRRKKLGLDFAEDSRQVA